MFKNPLRDSFFDNINGHSLDKYQRKIVLNNSKYLLVVAGAGSGKTLTIIGKIKYLIEKCGYLPSEILCLSFTNETVNNLKSRVNDDVDVLTFHKLALKILKDNNYQYTIASDMLLEYIVDEYFHSYLVNIRFLNEYLKKDIYVNKSDNDKFLILKNNIISFIKKIKCNNVEFSKLQKISKKVKNENKIFLIFAFDILRIYNEELLSTKSIDFDDMIINAKKLINRGGLIPKYKYIIIDEYQDISLIRFNLIKAILDKNNSNLMCVGDDYQSIYGFSGSNINLFIDFFKYFPGKRMDIKNTYRNSYQLIKSSIKFIMKNPYQLRKNIHAKFLLKYPIVLMYYDDLETGYDHLINYLYLEKKRNILTLARYNDDLKKIKNKNTGMNVKCLTVHMAKGLESENVILIKMSDDYLGFPSKIIDNNLSFFSEKEEIEYAEERRLFYVALTRTKERIYILVPKNNPSRFINEIKGDCVELLLK